jgi:hypothetical protein
VTGPCSKLVHTTFAKRYSLYLPMKVVTSAPHLPPFTGFSLRMLRISFNSSSLMTTSVEPKFSLSLSTLFVPGIGIAPCALTQARASWADVHFFFSAIFSRACRSFKLFSRFSEANRPASFRRSFLNWSGFLYLPVRKPAPSGENAMTLTPSSLAVDIKPLTS